MGDVLAQSIADTIDAETAERLRALAEEGEWKEAPVSTSMEFKAVPVCGFKDLPGYRTKDGGLVEDGVVECLVSVTGMLDRVKDIIEPGAYTKTLAQRMPKGVWSHQWDQPISKTLEIEELMPGDPRLPGTTKSGERWPRDAGALRVVTQFNLEGDRGRQAYADVKFFGADQEWSIGYNVPAGGAKIESKSGVRRIGQMDLFEYSPVLFGAMPEAISMGGVKSAQEAFRALSSDFEPDFEPDEDPSPLDMPQTKRTLTDQEAQQDAAGRRQRGTPYVPRPYVGTPKPKPKPKPKPAQQHTGGGGGADSHGHRHQPAGSPAGGQFAPSQGGGSDHGDGAAKKRPKVQPGPGGTHHVVAGDTLWALAGRYLGDSTRWREIAALNAIKDPRKMRTGIDLRLPGKAKPGKVKPGTKEFDADVEAPSWDTDLMLTMMADDPEVRLDARAGMYPTYDESQFEGADAFEEDKADTTPGDRGRGGNAETLRRYWSEGEGAAKIRWGQPGDFQRCVDHVEKYMPGQSQGYCNLLHHRALGFWPAQHAAMERGKSDEVDDETKDVSTGSAPPMTSQGFDAGTDRTTMTHCPRCGTRLDEDGRCPVDGFQAGVDTKFVSAEARRRYAGAGVALPDGSFPIPDKPHLRAAVAYFNRGSTGKDPGASRAHILKRARALGVTVNLKEDVVDDVEVKAYLKCAKCGHNEPTDDGHCGNCGAKLATKFGTKGVAEMDGVTTDQADDAGEFDMDGVTTVNGPDPSDFQYCPLCGRPLDENQFCPNDYYRAKALDPGTENDDAVPGEVKAAADVLRTLAKSLEDGVEPDRDLIEAVIDGLDDVLVTSPSGGEEAGEKVDLSADVMEAELFAFKTGIPLDLEDKSEPPPFAEETTE